MCGNVTLLGRRLRGEKSAFPKRAQTLLRDMLRVSQMRGAQSGGGAVQVRRGRRPGQVLKKCINPKRGDLAERLTGGLKRAAGHWPAHAHNFVVQTHVRYATAGHSSAHKCSSTAWPEASRSFAYALTIGRGRRTRCSRPPPLHRCQRRPSISCLHKAASAFGFRSTWDFLRPARIPSPARTSRAYEP